MTQNLHVLTREEARRLAYACEDDVVWRWSPDSIRPSEPSELEIAAKADSPLNKKARELMQACIDNNYNLDDEIIINLINELASILLFSKLKRLIGGGKIDEKTQESAIFREEYSKLRRQAAAAANTAAYIKYLTESESDNDLKYAALKSTLHSDGEELLQEIRLLIIKAIREQEKSGATADALTRVRVKDGKPTNDIKQINRKISDYLRKRNSIKASEKRYISAEELDESSTEREKARAEYIQAHSISFDNYFDYNGAEMQAVADAETERLIHKIIKTCNFTNYEKFIFEHYILEKDMTAQEVAEALNVSESTVNRKSAEIRRKIADSALLRTNLTAEDTARKNNTTRKRPVKVYDINGLYLRTYESISDAAMAMGAARGAVMEVLKGRRKTANGFIFKYAD